jgi:hypothetical protein
VDLADLVDQPGVEEDPLGGGRLARVDMGDDPDVSGHCEAGIGCVHLPDRGCGAHVVLLTIPASRFTIRPVRGARPGDGRDNTRPTADGDRLEAA